MPWYYAGPDAKPVGPITLEDLHACRVKGTVSPETYVIEYVGQPDDVRTWKRYREVFPTSPILPAPALSPPPPIPAPVQPHPLFPSAAPAGMPYRSHPPTYPVYTPPSSGRFNPWCVWGFGLGVGSFLLLLPSCGLMVLVAIPAFFISVVGVFKVQHDPTQRGNGLALTGALFSVATVVLAVLLAVFVVPSLIKNHGQITTTEQSTNDSE